MAHTLSCQGNNECNACVSEWICVDLLEIMHPIGRSVRRELDDDRFLEVLPHRSGIVRVRQDCGS